MNKPNGVGATPDGRIIGGPQGKRGQLNFPIEAMLRKIEENLSQIKSADFRLNCIQFLTQFSEKSQQCSDF
jgi:hypothetical protein